MQKRIFITFLCCITTVNSVRVSCQGFETTKNLEAIDQTYSNMCTISRLNLSDGDEFSINPPDISFLNYYNSIEKDISNEMLAVFFEFANMAKIPSIIFTQFINLQELFADDSGIQSLTKADFKNAKKLEILSCKSNAIKYIGRMLFTELIHVKMIDLSYNLIEEVDETAFYGLDRLTTLKLTGNKIKNLHSQMFLDLIALELLDVSHNKIHVLNGSISLDFDLKNCLAKRINISNNKISGSFEVKQFVTNFAASNNNISGISFEGESQLIELNISNNLLTHKDFIKITELKNLTTLDFSFNKIGNNSKLNVSSFLDMKGLEILNLQHCGVSGLEFGTFSHQTELKELDLSYNNLIEIQLDMFATLNELSIFYIEGNNLKQIDYENIKKILPKLTKIGLMDNNWNCSYLSKMLIDLKQNSVELNYLEKFYNTTNVGGIACHYNKTDEVNLVDLEKNIKQHQHLIVNDSVLQDVLQGLQNTLRHINKTSAYVQNGDNIVKKVLTNELGSFKESIVTLMKEYLIEIKHEIKKTSSESSHASIAYPTEESPDIDSVQQQLRKLEIKLNSFISRSEKNFTKIKSSAAKNAIHVLNNSSMMPDQTHQDSSQDGSTKILIILTFMLLLLLCLFFGTQKFMKKQNTRVLERFNTNKSETNKSEMSIAEDFI